MKTEEQLREKARYFYKRSMQLFDQDDMDRSRQFESRGDLLLSFVLEYSPDQKEKVWNEAVKDYKKAKEGK